jgi:hypothetical protein
MSFPLWPKEHKRRGEHVRISDSRPFELVAAKGAKSGGAPVCFPCRQLILKKFLGKFPSKWSENSARSRIMSCF